MWGGERERERDEEEEEDVTLMGLPTVRTEGERCRVTSVEHGVVEP